MAGRLDQTRPFLPVNIALLTVSDTRSAADDRSGNTLAELAQAAGHRIAARKIIRDEFNEIVAQLKAWIADPEIDVVIANGATGVTGRDLPPEAFHSAYQKETAGSGNPGRDAVRQIGQRVFEGMSAGPAHLPEERQQTRRAARADQPEPAIRGRPEDDIVTPEQMERRCDVTRGERRDVGADQYRGSRWAAAQGAMHALAEVAGALRGNRDAARPDPLAIARPVGRHCYPQTPSA